MAGLPDATDGLLTAMNEEAASSGSPYTFRFDYIGTSSGLYYFYGEKNITFNVYRITYKNGDRDYYFVPIDSESHNNCVYSLYDNYYELAYGYTCWM